MNGDDNLDWFFDLVLLPILIYGVCTDLTASRRRRRRT